ncbi:MAG: hypothetical protein F6J94_29520 [Moorea sp. SIO1F2]|uniref:hypothetical protein n=1 Tax=unclassified Moorena TaxID=2683338 RepID=UPI0013BC583B|nr:MULTISPECIES: hypothetical protein [unclassified Moorena]NEO22973.1 hypothetical protein [Moorena sp. SIO4A5]NEQ57765.1 hypothetical protein [Moorena sp. SIO4A1]NET85879.1 hypothetical protein [Moorena sp. SIO1F2]
MKRTIVILGFGLILGIFISQFVPPATASITVVESRIASVESEITNLRFKINQLESQLRQVSQSIPDSNRPSQHHIQSPTDTYSRVDPEHPMFKRLATLVIELKERVNRLEEEVLPKE